MASDDKPADSADVQTPPKGSVIDVLAMMRSATVQRDAAATQAALDELRGRMEQKEIEQAQSSGPVQRIANAIHALRATLDAESEALGDAPTVLRSAFGELRVAVDVTDDLVKSVGL